MVWVGCAAFIPNTAEKYTDVDYSLAAISPTHSRGKSYCAVEKVGYGKDIVICRDYMDRSFRRHHARGCGKAGCCVTICKGECQKGHPITIVPLESAHAIPPPLVVGVAEAIALCCSP